MLPGIEGMVLAERMIIFLDISSVGYTMAAAAP